MARFIFDFLYLIMTTVLGQLNRLICSVCEDNDEEAVVIECAPHQQQYISECHTISNEYRRTAHGIFYEGFDTQENRVCSVKFIPMMSWHPRTGCPRTNIEAFKKEKLKQVNILSRIQHPNVQSVRAFIDSEHSFTLILQSDIGCRSLRQLNTCGEVDLGRIAYYVLRALYTLHSRGFYHNNLSLDSIYIRGFSGLPVLRDFDKAGIIGSSNVADTPNFKNIDLYMLGNVLLQLFFGEFIHMSHGEQYIRERISRMDRGKNGRYLSEMFTDFIINLMSPKCLQSALEMSRHLAISRFILG